MQDIATMDAPPRSPLEDFFRVYVETIGGDWDEIEPQVYDVLLPAGDGSAFRDKDDRGVVRIAFDPEALPEHAGAQLASFGTPLVDRLLADAMHRGRFAQVYVVGLNLAPRDLPSRVSRSLSLGPQVKLHLGRSRPLYFTQAVYYFQATFVSDQKEQESVPIGLDLHFGREVRHLEQLLDRSRLSERPAETLAEARRLSLAAGYPIARESVLRSLTAMANTRTRELAERLDKQIARMNRYYADLRQELEDQAHRGHDAEEHASRIAARRTALEREQQLRTAELRQKSNLHVELRLLNVRVVEQPKLLLQTEVKSDQATAALELVWDPLTESLEAPPCPSCGRPGFTFELTRQGRLMCPTCPSATAIDGRRTR